MLTCKGMTMRKSFFSLSVNTCLINTHPAPIKSTVTNITAPRILEQTIKLIETNTAKRKYINALLTAQFLCLPSYYCRGACVPNQKKKLTLFLFYLWMLRYLRVLFSLSFSQNVHLPQGPEYLSNLVCPLLIQNTEIPYSGVLSSIFKFRMLPSSHVSSSLFDPTVYRQVKSLT